MAGICPLIPCICNTVCKRALKVLSKEEVKRSQKPYQFFIQVFQLSKL